MLNRIVDDAVCDISKADSSNGDKYKILEKLPGRKLLHKKS